MENLFFSAFLHKYLVFICSLERSDRGESGMSFTFEKKYFLVKFDRKKNRFLRIQYIVTLHDGKFDVNMTASDVVRTRHHIRRFLRRFMVLTIKPNTGQTLGTTDNIERRKNMAKSEGRALLTIETLRLSIVV